MQCPYCGRDIPDDARWCPYCGGEQAPPEARQDENIPPDGWQDPAPADDWDDEAEPQDDPWADDAPVPGWEEDAPYDPAPEDKDAPRSKTLLIAIFAALGVALIVLLIALNVKPKPKTEGKKGYVCKICGYVYEGETLPPDFVCPWCKHGAADFEPVT